MTIHVSEPSASTTTEEPCRGGSLAAGRTLVITNDRQGLGIVNAGGQIEIQIEITADGVRVRVAAADLELSAVNRIDVQCRDFRVSAEETLTLDSGAELAVSGGADLVLNGDEDVRVSGTKIYLN